MVDCGPSCTVPSCASTPFVGFGSAGLGHRGLGYGRGGFSLGYGGSVESSGSLGILNGVNPSCTSQLPPAEVVIQPPPTVLTIPGAILSASCEPVSVGGNTPCAVGGYGYRYGRGLSGDGYGYLGKRLGSHSGVCLYPC